MMKIIHEQSYECLGRLVGNMTFLCAKTYYQIILLALSNRLWGIAMEPVDKGSSLM